MFEEGLFQYLSTAGTSAGERIYPMRLPQGVTLPAVRYLKVSPGITYTQSGESGVREPRYQVECWGAEPLEAKALAVEMITVISNYNGAMGSTEVYAAFIEGEQDDTEPDSDRYRVVLDVIFQHGR